jgi:hypothetical protein
MASDSDSNSDVELIDDVAAVGLDDNADVADDISSPSTSVATSSSASSSSSSSSSSSPASSSLASSRCVRERDPALWNVAAPLLRKCGVIDDLIDIIVDYCGGGVKHWDGDGDGSWLVFAAPKLKADDFYQRDGSPDEFFNAGTYFLDVVVAEAGDVYQVEVAPPHAFQTARVVAPNGQVRVCFSYTVCLLCFFIVFALFCFLFLCARTLRRRTFRRLAK